MTTITVDDVTYSFIEHAETRMDEQKITLEMVEAVLLDPDYSELSKVSPNMLYVKKLKGQRFPLRVAVDEENHLITSAHWVSRPAWD